MQNYDFFYKMAIIYQTLTPSQNRCNRCRHCKNTKKNNLLVIPASSNVKIAKMSQKNVMFAKQ